MACDALLLIIMKIRVKDIFLQKNNWIIMEKHVMSIDLRAYYISLRKLHFSHCFMTLFLKGSYAIQNFKIRQCTIYIVNTLFIYVIFLLNLSEIII